MLEHRPVGATLSIGESYTVIVMDRRKRPIFGIGINDSETPVEEIYYVDGKKKKRFACPYFAVWYRMMYRCYRQSKSSKHPTYKHCKVDARWHRFSVFRSWMKAQDWQGKHLDKDIISPGNKTYCPEFCAFVEQKINNFVIDSGKARGKYPIGATWNKRYGKFIAACSNQELKKNIYLGAYDTAEEAHQAWKREKHRIALMYASQVSDKRVADALRVRYA